MQELISALTAHEEECSREFEADLSAFCTRHMDAQLVQQLRQLVAEGEEDLAYRAFYALTIIYRNRKDYQQLQALFEENPRFAGHPSYHHLLILFQLEAETFFDALELLELAREDARQHRDNAGYLHLFAHLFVYTCEKSRGEMREQVRREYYDDVERAVEDAIRLDPAYAKFYCTKARVVAQRGRYNWCSATVADILSKQEYCGDTVNFRSTTKSFKNKKKIERPPEEWQIFRDTHPAIIDRETFALVQELRKHRRRPTKSGIVSPFSGLLYCADCGEKLYYSVTGNYKREQAYFFCSSYRKNSEVCSAHYIRERVVEQIVLESMQRILLNVQAFEKEFARKQMNCYTEDKKKQLAAKRRELSKAKKRIAEIDALIQKIYEDNASGKLSDERYVTLSLSYEEEQKALKAAIPEMQAYLETETDKTESLQRFIQKVKQITELKALTPELIHEFVDKIVVYAPRYLDGKRVQLLDIYYSGVGILHELNPEEMEEAFQQHLAQRNKEKTA